jgi:Ca-activated chloride channel family protein
MEQKMNGLSLSRHRPFRARATLLSVFLFLMAGPGSAAVSTDEGPAGEIRAIANGREVSLPLLKANYDVDIDGQLATVTVEQVFLNPGEVPLNATYLFPLNRKAAVYAMKMEVGDEVVEAEIKRKEKARQTFETAKREGKAASLLVQHRPNMFTQNIANLMPQLPIKVTLKYVQRLPKIDNAYELVVPMVVGPRYEGKLPDRVAGMLGLASAEKASGDDLLPVTATASEQAEEISGWTVEELPAYPKVIGFGAPDSIDPERVSLALRLKSATMISGLYSSTHDLDIAGSENEATARFANGKEIDNRDLVVRYEIAKESDVAAGVSSHHGKRGGYLSLQIEPPKLVAEETITPRELVFVLDTSGSMSGDPMNASKVFMRAALKNMRPSDRFRILRFSNNTTQFAKGAVAATPENLRKGRSFVDGLSAGGGTEMNRAINAAFDLPPVEGTMRIVVFLTDGYIGGDRQVIQTVSRRIGAARIYAFGVGNAPNRFLLEGLAEEGRGRARYIEVGEKAHEVAETLAANLDSPLLTDISIDWNGLAVKEQTPARIPDLFAGTSVNVLARYTTGGTHRIILNGLVNGRKASMPLDVTLEEAPAPGAEANTATEDSAIPLIWAREQVFQKNRAFTIDGGTDKRLKEEITRLGLDYSLQTPFTSFVAVSKKVYNDTPGAAKTAQVPLPKVSGVSTNAYPSLNLSGSSAPEPAAWLGLFGALAMMVLRFRKKLASAFRRRREPRPAEINGVPYRVARDGWWLVE